MRVLFVAVPPVQIIDLTGPFEVFHRAGGYQVELVSATPGPVTSSCGLAIQTARHYASVTGPVDTLILPGGEGAEQGQVDAAFLEWLQARALSARRVCSICTGAFVLAKAGFLHRRRAVTHWRWCDALAAAFPDVRVERAPLFIKDGPYYTSGGVTAGMDLALALIEEDHGAARSSRIAQDLVMFLRRGPAHSQYSAFLAPNSSPSRQMEDLCAWIAANLHEDLSVPALAARCRMSPRNFARVFTAQQGVTPARFVERLRLSVAQALLSTPGAIPKQVAAATGFSSADAMRRALSRSGPAPGLRQDSVPQR